MVEAVIPKEHSSHVARVLRGRVPAGMVAALRDYSLAMSGSVGRLVFSLAYFVLLANTLSIAEFGIFATCSAAGVMLSRIVGFGYVSPLYRAATVRRRLIGLHTAGMLVLGVLSIPVLAGASWLVWFAFFGGEIAFGLFALFIVAEALLWRSAEIAIIVNNGMGRFGRAALCTIGGTAMRALFALVLFLGADPDLERWALYYLAANGIAALVTIAATYPRQRLRFRPRLWSRRMSDALAVCGAELLFYLQSELDKLLVLAIGGAQLAGFYAIVMRLVDLTALPIRSFTMLLVQKLMRSGAAVSTALRKIALESAIFVTSTLGLLVFVVMLWLAPNALGGNVAEAVPFIALVLAVPGFRNLIEYQAELLYGRGQSGQRTVNLTIIGLVKGLLLALLLLEIGDTERFMISLNAMFAALYLVSAFFTYLRLDPHRRAV